MSQQKILNYFMSNKNKKVIVNDIEYECEEGLSTPGGFYKNGWRSTIKSGKKSDTKYLQIFIYTSAKHRIWVEEKFMFKIIGENFKLLSWKGWDNIDLMRIDYQKEYMNMLNSLYTTNTK